MTSPRSSIRMQWETARPTSAPLRPREDCGRNLADPWANRMGSGPRPASPSGAGSSAAKRPTRRDCPTALSAAHEGDAAWFAKKQEWGEWRERYRELAQANVSDPDMQHQGIIKAVSR